MEISWSTFVLEIVNFLVLVWLLQHFLYRPVLDVIAQRRARVARTLRDAQALHEEAQALKQRYEGRLTEWNAEKQQAAASLSREIEAQRSARLQALSQQLAREKEQAELAERHRRAAAERQLQTRALEQAARFAARLLERASGPEVEARLVDTAAAELAQLPAEQRAALDFERSGPILVHSAYRLPDAERGALAQALERLADRRLAIEFAVDPELLAGVRIEIGAKTIAFNLADELEGFALSGHGD